MNPLDRFLAYAADFEKTRQDDDWARIEPYFRDDAVYRVESTVFGCEISGARSLCAGMRKSLEGFDRKMHRLATRKIEMTEPPKAEGDEVRLAWTVTYTLDDHPPLVARGCRERALFDGDRIALLVDSYSPEDDDALRAWLQKTGLDVDLRYV